MGANGNQMKSLNIIGYIEEPNGKVESEGFYSMQASDNNARFVCDGFAGSLDLIYPCSLRANISLFVAWFITRYEI